MFRQRGMFPFLASAQLALVLSLPAAAQLPEGFTARNIGDGKGSTTVTDGKWTVKGVGADIWGTDQDHFHFVAKQQSGDGTISARLLSATSKDLDGWQKIGPMIRETDAPSSPHLMAEMTDRANSGVMLHWRSEAEGESADRYGFGPRSFPMWLRVQRTGNDLSAYYSFDGQIWSFMRRQTIGMGDTAQYGLAIGSHDVELEDTAEFDNVTVAAGARTVSQINACGSDAGVLLTWAAVKGAQSYNVYRGPANVELQDVKLDQMAKVNTDAVPQASYTDMGDGVTPGALYVYAVAPVIDGTQGDLAAIVSGRRGAPTPPAGYTFTAIGNHPEGLECATGSIGVKADESGVITMRGGGHDIWDDGDDAVFLHQKVAGNFRVTTTMLTAPSGTSSWSKAGPMIRETVDRGSRNAHMVITGYEGATGGWRLEKDSASESHDSIGEGRILQWNEVRDAVAGDKSMQLRLTRQGDTITFEYSLDGTEFKSAGSPATISGLANELEVGVALTSHVAPPNVAEGDPSRIAEVKFRDVKIEKL